MLNKVQLIGNLGADAEMRDTKGGGHVTSFSVATTDRWKDKDGQKQEKTEWHRVVCFGKLADIAGEYLKKGQMVYVEGRLQTSSSEKDGEKRYSTEVIASDMKMLGGGKGDRAPAANGEARAAAPAAASGQPFEDRIPF